MALTAKVWCSLVFWLQQSAKHNFPPPAPRLTRALTFDSLQRPRSSVLSLIRSVSGMCVARCSRCMGVSLVPLAILSMVANALLLFPNLQTRYLLEGHVTREATWGTGLWASGFLVLLAARGFVSSSSKTGCCVFRAEMLCQVGYSCIALAAAGTCFLVSGTGLVEGPLCLHNGTQGPNWEVPLKRRLVRDRNYLYERDQWASACLEPQGVVLWNVVLFSLLMATSGIQVLLCAAHTLNALLGILCGPGFHNNKVGPA
ncbi:hypothetical protein SKAU_G00081500 [Synaphobranchus kaupii]|uniref:Uncharacterized protein n=1 Tax=Synaphobranchus kaupii TaxID=118154 RepID=A0A9Q1FV76_SYNKA|nr:hypothetical protein SKAU_G00081500 [Synaphobranchus kaupii]